MLVKPVAVKEGDKFKVYLWDGVTPSNPGEPLECDIFTARAVQVEGFFTRAVLEASCGGEFEKASAFSLPGVSKVDSEAVLFRPRVEGAEGSSAKFYMVVRR